MNERDQIRRLLHQLGAVVVNVITELEDEGDRIYLGSTNHYDALKDVAALYDNYRFDNGDMGDEDALSSVERYGTMQRAHNATPKSDGDRTDG